MILFYVRHGEPTYDPNALTKLGVRQAEALAKRFARQGLEKIYSSPSYRAYQTAEATAKALGLPITQLDFTNETYAWRGMTWRNREGHLNFVMDAPEAKALFASPEVRKLGFEWHTHSAFSDYAYGKEMERVQSETDAFLRSLGYEHERYSGRYRVLLSTDDRVALFAHGGFGSMFLSCLLDVPYPMFAGHFDQVHCGVTAIEFANEGEYSYPRIWTLSGDGHMYREDVPYSHGAILRY